MKDFESSAGISSLVARSRARTSIPGDVSSGAGESIPPGGYDPASHPFHDGRHPRLWEIGPGRGLSDSFPFSDHRTMAQVIFDQTPAHLRERLLDNFTVRRIRVR